MSWSDFIREVQKAKAEALKEQMQANMIIINTNLVKIPALISHDGFLPSMICGLEVRVTEDDLPSNMSFAIMEGRSERDKLVADTKERTAREILDEVSKHYGGKWLVDLYKKYGVEKEE